VARCNCGGSCGCVLEAGTNVTVGGTGSPGNPWVVSAVVPCATVRSCLSEGPGIDYDPVTGVISADLSSDPGNTAVFGGDQGIFVPAGVATVETGCGLTGDGTPGDPVQAVVVPWGFPCDITARSSNIYCNEATGELRGEPRARTYTNYQVQEHTPANLPVPAGAVLVPIDTFNFSHANPDQCRTMRLIVWADTDIDFSLPVGATAGFGIEGDRIVAMSNQGAAQISNQHFQVPRKVVDVNVAPGGVHNYTLTVSGERGAAGASYSRIQMQVNAIFEQN
jgi:hypothetical protein